MLVTQDPNSPTFRMDAFALPDRHRPGPRGASGADCSNGSNRAARATRRSATTSAHAFELLASGRVAGAFRLDREPIKVRDGYGRNQFGQSLLAGPAAGPGRRADRAGEHGHRSDLGHARR